MTVITLLTRSTVDVSPVIPGVGGGGVGVGEVKWLDGVGNMTIRQLFMAWMISPMSQGPSN